MFRGCKKKLFFTLALGFAANASFAADEGSFEFNGEIFKLNNRTRVEIKNIPGQPSDTYDEYNLGPKYKLNDPNSYYREDGAAVPVARALLEAIKAADLQVDVKDFPLRTVDSRPTSQELHRKALKSHSISLLKMKEPSVVTLLVPNTVLARGYNNNLSISSQSEKNNQYCDLLR